MSGVGRTGSISICDAWENNLKHIYVDIPLDALTCVTGPSGCGKSSLVFDTLFAESQRNYLEGMSGNLFGQKIMDKPQVGKIVNLRPAISISQGYYNCNPRSSIGTVTDVSYYLRTLFAFLVGRERGIDLSMSRFSPNNPSTCCPRCGGLGEVLAPSERLVIPDETKTLASGGIRWYAGGPHTVGAQTLASLCEHFGIDHDKRVADLNERERHDLLYRIDPVTVEVGYRTPKGRRKYEKVTTLGAMVEIEEALKRTDKPSISTPAAKYAAATTCPECGGLRMCREVLDERVCGLSIGEAEHLSVSRLLSWVDEVAYKYETHPYSQQVLPLLEEIKERTDNLVALKLAYLSLDRRIPTLSGGELQRVRLASQLSCRLSGLMYILDEPCKGLHVRDVSVVAHAARSLVGEGNTVVAIEHNRGFISASDHVIEMGPSGGEAGGRVVSVSDAPVFSPLEVVFKIPKGPEGFAKIKGIDYRNLKGVDVELALGCVTCLSGVSGSGKSSLFDVIEECASGNLSHCATCEGFELFTRVRRTDQRPIGKNVRSTVVSYLEIYDEIRSLFADTDEAKARDLGASHFSMNVDGGRCEVCKGAGRVEMDLTYLPSTFVVCPECGGRRFGKDVLSVRWRGMTIDEVLSTPVSNLLEVFEDVPPVINTLRCLVDIGLGYLRLGQMSMTLSGGEAQRVRLSKTLGVSSRGRSLIMLDEPTSGLTEADAGPLVAVIGRLIDRGDTVMVIEHNPVFIGRIADCLIDLGDKRTPIPISGGAYEVMHATGTSWEGVLDKAISNGLEEW